MQDAQDLHAKVTAQSVSCSGKPREAVCGWDWGAERSRQKRLE